jgi:hypothetical protein
MKTKKWPPAKYDLPSLEELERLSQPRQMQLQLFDTCLTATERFIQDRCRNLISAQRRIYLEAYDSGNWAIVYRLCSCPLYDKSSAWTQMLMRDGLYDTLKVEHATV